MASGFLAFIFSISFYFQQYSYLSAANPFYACFASNTDEMICSMSLVAASNFYENMQTIPAPRIDLPVEVKFVDGYGYEKHFRQFVISILSSQKVNIPGTFKWRKMVRKRLIETNLFSSIFFVYNQKTYKLRILLLRKPLIRKIKITSNFPVLKKEILSVLNIRSGMTININDIDINDIDRQNHLIEKYLHSEGFRNPSISIVNYEIQPGLFDIMIYVFFDKTYFLSSIKILGASGVSKAFWYNKIKGGLLNFFLPENSIRFNENNFRRKVKKFNKILWKKGYCDGTVSIKKIQKSAETGKVAVSIKISEGPHYEISINGNEEYSNRKLLKKIIVFKEGNRKGRGLQQSLNNLLAFYHNKGFAHVIVTFTEKLSINKPFNKIIKFNIKEGKRCFVSSIDFSGNKHFKKALLKQKLLAKNEKVYRKELIDADSQNLQAFYIRNGFIYVKVSPQIKFSHDNETDDAHIVYTIEEGKKFKYGKVTIEGLPEISFHPENSNLFPIEGKPFREIEVQQFKNLLASNISEDGYPHVKISLSHKVNHNTIDVHYHVFPGLLTKVGKIFFLGNFKTKPKVILKELKTKQNDSFSMSRAWFAEQNVRNIEIFRFASFHFIGINDQVDEIPILISVSEKNPYFFEIGTGFNTDTGFKSSLKVGNKNLFGLNKKSEFLAEARENGEIVQFTYRDPRIFWSRTAAVLTTKYERFLEENAYQKKENSLSLGFFKRISSTYSVALNNNYISKQVDILENTEKLNLSETRTRNVFVVSPSVIWQKKDDFFRPKKGFLFSPIINFSQGINTDIDDFIKINFTAAFYRTPIDWCTFATSIKAGQAFFYGKNKVLPKDEQYYLGGMQNVRGFKRNLLNFKDVNGNLKPLGGNAALSGSMELRFSPFEALKILEIPLFMDFGYVTSDILSPTSNEIREAWGSGIRFYTPVGPISLLYAAPLNRRKKEDSFQIHFQIGL